MLHSALINVMVKAARRAGRSLKRDLGEVENLQVSLKGPANFVTMADRRAEEMLHSDLTKARPGYGFIGEEGGTREGDDKSHTWIVDPLDGTTNFLHGIPQFAISIGLQREGTMIAGLIYNPANDDLYIAERGKGAFLNDQRLRVAGRRNLADCVIACGLPHIGRGDHDLSRKELTEIQNKVAGLRRFGAASLDMAFIASGRLDGYWERNLSPWDMAAGQIIVREAGGTVSGIDVVLCGYADAKAAQAAEAAGVAAVGETTGTSLSRDTLLLVVADRRKADPAGRTINQITKTFLGK